MDPRKSRSEKRGRFGVAAFSGDHFVDVHLLRVLARRDRHPSGPGPPPSKRALGRGWVAPGAGPPELMPRPLPGPERKPPGPGRFLAADLLAAAR